MAQMGYNQQKISTFSQIYQAAAEANFRQNKEYSEKAGAYSDFEKLFSGSKEQLHYLSS